MPTKIIASKLKKPSGTAALKASKKGQKGFTQGISGNPKGRPRGSRNKAGLLVQKLIDGKSEEIARAIIKRAIKGDFQAEKFCLERLLPPQRSRPVTVALLYPYSDFPDFSGDSIVELEDCSDKLTSS